MSASSTPTRNPRWASPAARLTVIDDLPTPPLPEEMASTRVRLGMRVVAARSLAFQRARAMSALRCSASMAEVWTDTPSDAREPADPLGDVPGQLAPQRAGGGGQGQVDDHGPVVGDPAAPVHAEIDDVVAELGVDDPAHGLTDDRLGDGSFGAVLHVGSVPADGADPGSGARAGARAGRHQVR